MIQRRSGGGAKAHPASRYRVPGSSAATVRESGPQPLESQGRDRYQRVRTATVTCADYDVPGDEQETGEGGGWAATDHAAAWEVGEASLATHVVAAIMVLLLGARC